MFIRLSAITPKPTQRCMPSTPWQRQRRRPWRRLSTLMGPSHPTRQDHASDTAVSGGPFVGRRTEAAITGGQIRSTTEDRLMSIQRRCPQRDVGWPRRMDLVGGHDLMFGFLNGHQVPELVRFRDLTFADRHGVPFEEAENFVGHVRVPAQHPRPRLRKPRCTKGRVCCNWSWAGCRIGCTGACAVRMRCPSRRTIVAASRWTARAVAISLR